MRITDYHVNFGRLASTAADAAGVRDGGACALTSGQ